MIKHTFTSPKLDTADTTKIQPSHWNAAHRSDGEGIIYAPYANSSLDSVAAGQNYNRILKRKFNSSDNEEYVFKSLPFVEAADFDFTAQTPTGNITSGITSTITLSPVPLGINATDIKHYIRIVDNVAGSEVVKITGGTAVSGAASGTITFVSTLSHASGNYTVTTATAGIQEAIYYSGYDTGCQIKIGAGNFYLYAPIYVYSNRCNINGLGNRATILNFSVPTGYNWIETAYGASGFSITDLGLFGELSSGQAIHTGWALYSDMLTYSIIRNICIEGAGNGLNFQGGCTNGTVEKVTIYSMNASTGVGVIIGSGANQDNTQVFKLRDVSTDKPDGAKYNIGVLVKAGAEILIESCEFMRAKIGIHLSPDGVGASIGSMFILNNSFDNCGDYAAVINPINNGVVARVVFGAKNWFNAAGIHNLWLYTTTGTIKSVEFIGCEFLSAGNCNVVLEGVEHCLFSSCTFSHARVANVYVTNGSYVSFVGNHFGDVNDIVTETADYGLFIDTSPTYLLVVGNVFHGNTVANLSDNSTTVNKVVHSNIGVDNTAVPTIASASSIDLRFFHSPVVYISGTTTVLTIQGGYINRRIRLINLSAITIGGGGNIPFATALLANQSREVVFDGTNWY